MAQRTLHLIVTDYDINGLVRVYHSDKLWTPKLVEAVNNLNLDPERSAVCYTLISDEALERMENEDILDTDLWRYRAEDFSDPLRRPDDSFVFEYSPGNGRRGLQGGIPWACRTNNLSLFDDSVSKFHQILEGQYGLEGQIGPTVGVVIDCTDHPLMYAFLQGLGYNVQRQEVFNFGPWPERK